MSLKNPVVFAIAVVGALTFAGDALASPDQSLGMAIMSAHVSTNGSLEGGAGAVGAFRQAKGQYFVAFNRPVDGCTYVGAVSGPNSLAYSGFVTARRMSGTVNGATYVGVEVNTSDQNALIFDIPFHLIVFCAR